MSAAEKSWRDLIAVADLETDDATPVSFGNRDLAVFDARDGIFVTSGRCSHAGAPLCDGYFDGTNIECPLHQGLFDVRTGEAKAVPARVGLRVYESRVQNGMVQILY